MRTTTTLPAAGVAIVGVVERGSTAVLVTLGADGTLIDRRQIELVPAGLSTHPHHHEGSWAMGRYLSTPGARRLPLAEAVALVGEVRQSARRRAADALEALARESAAPIGRIAIRACPEMPATVEARIADPRVQTFADSVMYREALAEAACARGWAVHWYDRERVTKDAAAAVPDVDVPTYLKAMGRAAGPPWTAEHRLAAAAALASNVARGSRSRRR